MGLGVLEDRKLAKVPGTVSVFEEDSARTSPNANLKYDSTGHIILVPQPSDDPNDPLNWPLWKRDVYLLTLSLLAVIASTLSPLLAANTLTIALFFGRKFDEVALLTGYHLLGVGVAGFLFVPSARIWGKRHLYILGTVFLIFSSAWGGSTKLCGGHAVGLTCYDRSYYVSLTWARVFQGVGLAPFEALVNASVGDLYFVHERGKRMALTTLALFGGAFCTPIIVGKMTSEMGWEWPFYFVAIFCAALLPVVIFFLPETAYRRDDRLNTDTYSPGDSSARLTANTSADAVPELGNATEINGGSANSNNSLEKGEPVREGIIPEKQGYWASVKPFNGRKSDDGYLNLLLRPFPLFFHPGILWACLIQGTLIGWTVMIGVVLAAIMLGYPLFFSEVETGYMYTGAFLGAIIGFLISGLLSDYSVKVMTKWNKGIYEPEFRLVLVIPQAVLGVVGLYCFGWVSANPTKYGWFWPDFFFACEVAGMVIGAVASALYIVDAHRDIAVEAFTCLIVFKNVFSFGLTYDSYNWIVDMGIWPLFRIVGSVQIGICALTIPMYIFGKKNRSYFARHPVFFRISDAVANFPSAVWNSIAKRRKS